MAHITVPEAEQILDREFPVLDKGFVRLVDYLGGDQRIVQAARVSYGEGTRSFREDAALIDYLLRHEHTSPFEQVILTFHAKMPIFVARQWVRHRTARLNEISGRYSILKDEFFVPAGEDIALQSDDNKQGRAAEPVPADVQERIRASLRDSQERSYTEYTALIDEGVARELARVNLPVSMYTEWYWQIDLHNLFHFLRLRMDPHAQKEIRAYATAMFEIARVVCPAACASFQEHVLGSVRFSAAEWKAVRLMLAGAAPAGGTPAGDAPAAAAAAAAAAGIAGKALERFLAKLETGAQQ